MAEPSVLGAVIAAIPAVAAPFIAWYLDRRGVERVTALEQRLRILRELASLDQHLAAADRAVVQAELGHLVADLAAVRARERPSKETVTEGLPLLRRALLLYEQPTRRASIYRGLFWAFLVLILLGSAGVLVSIPGEPSSPTLDLVALSLGLGVYLVIGLAFRAAAVHQQRHARTSAGVAP